jgi:hypothetical protein
MNSLAPSQEVLNPFLRACESKYPKLAAIALSALTKLLANDAVSSAGRSEILKSLIVVG